MRLLVKTAGRARANCILGLASPSSNDSKRLANSVDFVRLGRPEAAALGLPARTAMAGAGPSRTRANSVVGASRWLRVRSVSAIESCSHSGDSG